MAYTINLTDGTIFAVVADGTINTSSSMTLIGKNYAGYGDFLDENFIHLLENGSNTTAPGAPLTGQLWWDKTNNLLKVYNGTTFKTISAATASASAPTNNVVGDLWFDTANQLLKVYTGTGPAPQFLTVGPSTVAGTGVQATTIIDNTSTSHPVVTFTIDNDTVAILSQDSAFTPQSSITGWGSGQQIKPGLNLSTSGGTYLFQGTATDAQTLDGLDSTQFLRNDTNGTLTGNLVVNGSVGVNSLINNNANGVGNIGSASTYFNTVFATATRAQYADVAERFAADEEYQAGTVVELGGSAEITCARTELSDSVFGVISTRAAYLMNDGAGSDVTHPPVAMTGRVPVRVVGQIAKGDRLVSAGNGLARAAKDGEATAFNVIGRALTAKYDTAEGTVEAIVTIK
jgi:hypothetical protein